MWKHSKIALIVVVAVILLCGCERVNISFKLNNREFSKFDDTVISMDRANILLSEARHSYESALDEQIWDKQIGNVEMEEYIKNSVKDTIFHLYVLGKIADQYRINLSEEDRKAVRSAALEYIEEDSPYFEEVIAIYSDMLRANRAFVRATEGVDMEVSEDEARVVSVSYLFISTMKLDENGELVKLKGSEYNTKKQLAKEAKSEADSTNNFMAVVEKYSEDTQNTLTFGRGERNQAFERETYKLEAGQISGVVETEYGFYIIKCTNDNVDSDFEARKEAIITSRRMDVFAVIYKQNAEKVEARYNDEYWDSYRISDAMDGSGRLYSIFDDYFIVSTH